MRHARQWATQLIVTILVTASSALAQTSWWRTFGGAKDDYGNSVSQSPDGDYIIAGGTWSFGVGTPDSVNVYLIRTNTSGDTVWTKTYGGMSDDWGNSVQPTSDGGYVIAGYTQSSGARDVYLIKTNASGDTQWTRTYGGPSYDEGYSLQQTSDSGYIIAGWTTGAGNYDVYLIKTNASGDTLWTRTYGGAGADEGYSVQQTTDSGYVVAGSTASGNGDVYLIKTSASGDTQWTRTYGGTDYDQGLSVQQTSDGGYVVAGRTLSFGPGGGDVYLIKTSASGDTQWTRTFGGTNDDEATSVHLTSGGGYVIAGMTMSFGAGSFDVYLVKTDSNGQLAVEEPSTPQLTNSQTAFRVTPNPFSSFAVVTGHESERFILSDISGRKVGICSGNRIGEGLPPGVYFLSPAKPAVPSTRPLRIVKGG